MNTVRRTAQKLGISIRSTYRLVERRDIEYVRLGGLIRITDEAIEHYLSRHTKQARA